MDHRQATERVKCPNCGQKEFEVIPGSECFCVCGTAFRIRMTGRPEEIAIAGEVVTWSRGRQRNARRLES
jgi:hypothetical protein